MADKNHLRNPATTALFEAILSLQSMEECYTFFEDLCTMKELADMAQRLEAAKMLLDGKTYEQIVKSVEISTATISRINRCIQYGTGGFNFHGPCEYITAEKMDKSVEIILNIISIPAVSKALNRVKQTALQ